MTAENTPSLLPSYKNPPVEEVACGCVFEPLEQLKLPHIGLLWQQFRKDLPTVEHAPPIPTDTGDFVADRATSLPWPRTWFINDAESRLVQFQPDRLYFNWRSREEEPDYPRYGEMIDGFAKYYELLEEFIAREGLGLVKPTVCELTYINHISQNQGWNDLSDMPKVFKDFCWTPQEGRFLPAPVNISWKAVFPLPNDTGVLFAKLGQAVRKNTPLIVLELTARGIGKETTVSGMKDWFDMAREWIVKGFADLTSDEVQKTVWGRER